jgi:hypothetical protein
MAQYTLVLPVGSPKLEPHLAWVFNFGKVCVADRTPKGYDNEEQDRELAHLNATQIYLDILREITKRASVLADICSFWLVSQRDRDPKDFVHNPV